MKKVAPTLALLLLLGSCQPAGRQPEEGRVPADERAEETEGDDRKPPIVVDSPQEGEELTSPAVISGTANVFEATVSYRIVSDTGEVLARGFTTASCGTGCRGTYSVTVPFKVEEKTAATIELFEESAEDGKPLHQVELDVTLLPS